MPTFPTYRGELPECLNPLNLRHYLLLLYWIFFRPTALKCYLYQADPELYASEPGLYSFVKTWYAPTYRNLYLMVPNVMVLISFILHFFPILITYWEKDISFSLAYWIGYKLIFILAVGLMICILGSLISNIGGSILLGILGSAMLELGTLRDLFFEPPTNNIVNTLLLLVTWGIGFTIIIVIGSQMKIWLLILIFGLLASLTSTAFFGVVVDERIGVQEVSGIAVNIINYIIDDVSLHLNMLIFHIGVLRILFYPFQLFLALCYNLKVRHPLEWDELAVLPLPHLRQFLMQRIQKNEREGLQSLADVGRNPLQRWAVQVVLRSYLQIHPKPLHFLYNLSTYPELDEFMFAPVKLPKLLENSWINRPKRSITIRMLFFNALISPLNSFSNYDFSYNQLVWRITSLLYRQYYTPLIRVASIIEKLSLQNQLVKQFLQDFPKRLMDDGLIESTSEAIKVTSKMLTKSILNDELSIFSQHTDLYYNLLSYPGGKEIAQTFNAMATFLSYNELSNLPKAVENISNLTLDDPVRPTVLTVLNRLGEVGAGIATYRDSTSRANQMVALARATDALKDLDEYVQTEVMAPEQYILQHIIRQWQGLIIEAGWKLGRAEVVEPVANPYVIANPVIGGLFVGREDIMQRLEELWVGEGQKPSVVIYGHRRMGKSSILDNLGARFGAQTIIVDFNMQREGMVESSGELLYNLALAMYDALPTPGPSQEGNGHPPTPLKGGISLPEPEEEQFTTHNPYTALNRFLKRLDQERGEYRFIIMVDEFELIEELIEKEIVEARLLDFWRSLIQTYPWFVMALAGLHTLQEMTEDYWHPLFASVIGIQVSFLRPAAARKLITQPTPDFPIDYDQDAIDMIIALTNGQPYLVQLICHGLVTRFNRQRFEEGVERERRFSLEDVEAVINAPEFFRDGNAYFTGVWVQAEKTDPAGQTQVLRTLAESETGKSAEEIARGAGLTLEGVHAALETLVRHDVVKKENDHWQFTVELMRRWVVQKAAA